MAFIARNPKVARAARQKVLNRLVVAELGKAAEQTGLPIAEALAKLAVSAEVRAACIVAARAAELDLYNRCKTTAVRINAPDAVLFACAVPDLVSPSDVLTGGFEATAVCDADAFVGVRLKRATLNSESAVLAGLREPCSTPLYC